MGVDVLLSCDNDDLEIQQEWIAAELVRKSRDCGNILLILAKQKFSSNSSHS